MLILQKMRKAVGSLLPENKDSKNQRIGIEHGHVGTDLFGGYLDVDYQTKWRNLATRIDTIDEMVGSDGTIEAILDAYKNPIMSAKYFVKPASEEAKDVEYAAFIEHNLFNELQGGFKNFLWETLTMYDYGFSVFEKVFKIKDGKIMWHKFAPRIQESIEKWGIDGEQWEDGHPAGITQEINYSDESTENSKFVAKIPWDKLILFSHKRIGNNFEGKSVLRFCYIHWFMKNLLYKISSISADRFGTGIPYIKHKTGVSDDLINEYKKLVKNIKSNERGYAVFDENVVEFDILVPKGNSEKGSIEKMILHHDRKIYDSILAGFLNLTAGEGGSNALSQDQSSFFLRGLQGSVDYILGVINEHIKDLVIQNFGEQEGYPELMSSDIGQISLDEYINSIKAAKEVGMLTWLGADEDKIREQLKLPPIKDEDREAIKEEKPEEVPKEKPKEVEPKEIKASEVRQFAKTPTDRERQFYKNISDFENYLESEYHNYVKIVEVAEAKLQKGLAMVYGQSDIELMDGVKVLAFSKKNKQLQKKALDFIDKVQKQLSDKIINGAIQNRLFEKTRIMSKGAIKDNLKMLQEIKINESQFSSFVSGHVSNVKGILFNEPRRMSEKVILNYGSQVSIDLAVKQAGKIKFNRNILKLSTVTHARGAYNAVHYDNSVKNGFTMFKPVVPKGKMKDVTPSGITSSLLFKILVAAEINRRINKKTDGENIDAITGLNVHHGGFLYYYPIATENLEEEKKIAKEQREKFEKE